jgi:hypothetical protein
MHALAAPQRLEDEEFEGALDEGDRFTCHGVVDLDRLGQEIIGLDRRGQGGNRSFVRTSHLLVPHPH